MMPGNGQLSVPPGFRFHPTDEELLYYYLRKKVSYEAIDLDVIREVDLNKLEPWDLKDNCRIGSGPQNEWYFFSHKDKKYPTGTRTNRATRAGFWKATGRDKAIHLSSTSKRIGMRKTLVFYTGRAPHGQKTDWIMHEYRLDDDDAAQVQEDGWVVCRVFKKKIQTRGFQPEAAGEDHFADHTKAAAAAATAPPGHKHNLQTAAGLYDCNFEGSMHLPQLLSPESAVHPSFLPPAMFQTMDVDCSQSLLRLNSSGYGGLFHHERFNGEWSFLDKLLASTSHQNNAAAAAQALDQVGSSSAHRFPFQYLGSDTDVLKFASK